MSEAPMAPGNDDDTADRIERLRAELGGVHPLAATKIKSWLEPLQMAFVSRSPFLVIATADAAGNCDASPKGGTPGFVRVIDERTLLLPDYHGNRLFQSYENFSANPHVGIVFMIPGSDVTLRVNGSVEVLEAAALKAGEVGSERLRDDEPETPSQGIRITIDEAYFHCPRSFQFAGLWETSRIESNVRKSLKALLSD